MILLLLASVPALAESGCVCGTPVPSVGFVPFVDGPDLRVRASVQGCLVATSSLLLAEELIGRKSPSLV